MLFEYQLPHKILGLGIKWRWYPLQFRTLHTGHFGIINGDKLKYSGGAMFL
jgi:hypothetical protein